MSQNFSYSIKSPVEFLDIMNRYGLGLGDHTGGRFEEHLRHLKIHRWYTRQFRAMGKDKAEYVVFLEPTYFLKTIRMTEESLNMRLFI